MKAKFKKILFLALILLFSPLLVGAITFDNFDSYNDGNLNGQGGWVGEDYAQVQGTTTQAGLKAIYVPVGSIISKTLGLSNGSITAWLRTALSTTSDSISFQISNTGGVLAEIYFVGDGNIWFFGGDDEIILNGYTSNTWYKVEMEWRDSDLKMRARVNDGTWSNWIYGQDCCPPSWTEVEFVSLSGDGEGYFDSISYFEVELEYHYLPVLSEFPTNVLAYAGDLFVDLNLVIILAIGLPLGFWVIRKVISLVKAR